MKRKNTIFVIGKIYKAESSGCQVWRGDKFEPTTQTCGLETSLCGEDTSLDSNKKSKVRKEIADVKRNAKEEHFFWRKQIFLKCSTEKI